MRSAGILAGVTLAVLSACASGACTTKEPQPVTFFDQQIDPVLQTSCARTNTGVGCHVADTKGNAFGNLDLSTYAGVDRRRDLLLDYGPYLQPSMLVKNVPPYQLSVELWDGTNISVTTDIKHTGGPILDPTASSYQTLRRWIENGASEENTGVPPVQLGRQVCNHTVPAAQGFDPTADPSTADYPMFEQTVEPFLATSCAFGNCHGTSVNALYLTCGSTPPEVRWNYFAAGNYVSGSPTAGDAGTASATAEQSEILRRPLATSQGGSYHEGGPLFSSVQDPNYKSLLAWAQAHGPPSSSNLDPAFLFFARMVQPVLVKKGCMMAQCHSAAMFHDYRLRGGSAGSFSLTATQKNYALSVAQMSFESDDIDASRLVRKNLYRPELVPGSNGIAHRGGALFEDFGSSLPSAALCDLGNYTYDSAHVDQIPAYCVISQWHKLERAERMPAPLSAVVYVSRTVPSGADRPQDFDVFAGGASLHIAAVTPQPGGSLVLGADTVVSPASCGLAAGSDIKRPAVSWDGKTIAFAARSTAADPLAIYTMNADGTACAKQADIAAHRATGNSLLEHDFDPAFSPPGADGVQRIVFASTRGNLDSTAFDYSGPQTTPADPAKPNANLYVLEPDPGQAGQNRVRQLTWQLDMERLPSFMQDGRLVFTAEKREPSFYQLALRRQNLDGGDYHPLYAQRSSIGYTQATYVTELAHKDFAAIFSNQTAQHGAGALAVFNRSLGVDFTSPDASDYLADPSVIDPSSPSSPEADFFLHSLRILDSGGCYTSPSALPDGQILVSYGAGDPATFSGDYDVYVMDPSTGSKTKLLGSPGTAEVEAAGVFARVNKGIFASSLDEPNGHTVVQAGQPDADVTVLDMTVLGSLLFQNTPTGRLLESGLREFEVYEELPPGVTSYDACGSTAVADSFGKVCVRRRLLGTVPVQDDGSAHFRIPGGMPVVLHLPADAASTQMNLPRWQREAMTFTPGEMSHQGMPAVFFDNLCAGCHGAISGHAIDSALKPDFLTQASDVAAATTPAADLTEPPSQRGSVIAPPFAP